jgi:hypothetical protein
MAYKMKGSPFQRNFGVGSPLKQDLPKDFNIKGDSWKVKTPGYKDTKAAKIKEALKTHHKHTTGPEAMKTPKKAKVSKIKQLKKVAKKYAPKILKQAGKRLGPIGTAITVAEAITTIPKVSKATVKGLKKRAKSGNVNIGRKL